MIMPWGKYKDMDLEDIPTDYIHWLLGNCTLTPHLQKDLEDQLTWRAGQGVEVKRDE